MQNKYRKIEKNKGNPDSVQLHSLVRASRTRRGQAKSSVPQVPAQVKAKEAAIEAQSANNGAGSSEQGQGGGMTSFSFVL